MVEEIILLGNAYSPQAEAIRVEHIANAKELARLVEFPKLRYLSLANSNAGDEDMRHLAALTQLQELSLQGTAITGQGLGYLAPLQQLHYLRLKECEGITGASVPALNALTGLQELHLQESHMDQAGLNQLALPQLKSLILDLWQANYTYAGLLAFSRQFPACEVLVKGQGAFLNGNFEGKWE